MGNYRQPVTTFTTAPIIISSPTGDQAARLGAIPEGTYKLQFPAESGNLFVTWGTADTVDGAADETADFYVPWGGVVVVAVPPGKTHFSVATGAADDWTVVVQGVE